MVQLIYKTVTGSGKAGMSQDFGGVGMPQEFGHTWSGESHTAGFYTLNHLS